MTASPQRRVALSLLAHPDDAEMFCAGTLIRLADAGWEIHIATVANGDCGSTTLPRAEIAAVRRKEGIAAAAKINATYHCLDEPDIQVVFDKPTNRKAIDLLRRIAPTLLFTHPRHDYMLDHEQVHLLARAAAFSYPIPNASDAAADSRLGDSLAILLRSGRRVAIRTRASSCRRRRMSMSRQQMDRKIEMLACHASQRDWLRAHHGMDEYIEAMKRYGAERGRQIGVSYAEAFVQHRGHPFPQTDLLAELK